MRVMFAGTITQYAQNKIGQKEARKKVDERLSEAKAYFSHAAPKLSNGEASPMAALEAMKPDPIKQRLAAVTQKLKAGRRLSAADMSFLHEHAPSLYDKAVQIEEDRANYKDDLRSCRTKLDVARAKAMRLSSLAADFQHSDQGEEATMTFHMRVNAINDEHDRFVRSKRYMELPEDDKDERKRGKRKNDDDEIGGDSDEPIADSGQRAPGEPAALEDVLWEQAEKRDNAS